MEILGLSIGKASDKSKKVVETKKPYKKSPKTLDQILKESYTKEIARNSTLRNELAGKVIGREYGIAESDPAASERKALDISITKAAMETINKDPALKETLARQRANEILGIKESHSRRDEESQMVQYDDESSLSRALREIRELREFQEEINGGVEEKKGNGFTDLLKDPDIVKALIGLVAGARGNGSDPSVQIREVPVRTFIVEIEGQQRELSETDYRNYKLQLQAAQNQPKLEAAKREIKDAAKIDDMNPVGTDDPVMAYLNLDPEEFVKQLFELSEGNPEDRNTQQALAVIEILKTETFEMIKARLDPAKIDPKFKIYADKIISEQKKVEAVIKFVTERDLQEE